MWIVSEVGRIVVDEMKPEPFMHIYNSVYSLCNVYIRIRDPERGTTRVIRERSWGSLLASIKRYKPYGFVLLRDEKIDDIKYEEYAVVAIDDYSWQFLGAVESVEEVHFPRNSTKIGDMVLGYPCIYTGMDKYSTLFQCDTIMDTYCTLFQAACYSCNGWIGDTYYLYSGKRDAYAENGAAYLMSFCYKVEFNNVGLARSLLGKAAIQGINPVREYIERELF